MIRRLVNNRILEIPENYHLALVISNTTAHNIDAHDKLAIISHIFETIVFRLFSILPEPGDKKSLKTSIQRAACLLPLEPYICIYIYIYIHTYIHMYIYIYI